MNEVHLRTVNGEYNSLDGKCLQVSSKIFGLGERYIYIYLDTLIDFPKWFNGYIFPMVPGVLFN